MNKKEWQKLMFGVIIAVLFGLILVTILSFTKNPENIVIEDNPIKKEEIVFQNNSSMSEKDIRDLLEAKREEFTAFINNIEYYKISEVGEKYTIEDDEKYLVLKETTLTELRNLVTEEFYTTYWDKLTEIVPKATIQLSGRIYEGPIDLFDELYSKSAIAQTNVSEEILILKSATDEEIVAIENIKLCGEDSDICTRDDKYNYVLKKENDIWKINKLI